MLSVKNKKSSITLIPVIKVSLLKLRTFSAVNTKLAYFGIPIIPLVHWFIKLPPPQLTHGLLWAKVNVLFKWSTSTTFTIASLSIIIPLAWETEAQSVPTLTNWSVK